MLKYLIQVFKAKSDGRVLVMNFGYLTILQFSSYIFPLITIPYMSRIIGAEGFGKLAFASAVMIWIQTIADWGFNYTATRDVAQVRNDKEKVSKIFSTVLFSRLLLSLFSGFILLIITILIPKFRESYQVLAATYIMVLALVFYPDWFFQALERMKYTTLFNLIIKLIFTCCVFVFIKSKEDYIMQPILIGFGNLCCGLIAMVLIVKKWRYKLSIPTIKEIIDYMKSSTNVFVNNIMPNFYNSLSVVLVGVYGGNVATGYYDGANRFILVVKQIQDVLSRVFFPFLSRRNDKHSAFVKINIGFSLFASILLIVFAPLLVRVMLGPEFKESVIVIRILAVSLIFQTLYNTYGINYLTIYHLEHELRNLLLITSFLGLFLAIFLVGKYTYIGAALVLLICRCILGVSSYIKVKNHRHN